MPLFVYKEFQLEYRQWGEGVETLVFFHGFGRHLDDAVFFLPMLRPSQRLVAVNLFGHGQSIFPKERLEHSPLEPIEWKEILESFMGSLNASSVHLVGYSMGGRVAMVSALLLEKNALSLLLLAPDGLKVNPLYTFASGTKMGRQLYRYFMDKPEGLFWTARWLNRLGLLSDKLLRFVHVHLDTVEKRELVHDAWLVYRKCFPNLKSVGEWVDQGRGFAAIFGKYDAIIPPKLAKRLEPNITSRKMNQWFFEVELGHRLLEKKSLDLIAENQLWP